MIFVATGRRLFVIIGVVPNGRASLLTCSALFDHVRGKAGNLTAVCVFCARDILLTCGRLCSSLSAGSWLSAMPA